MSVALKGTSTIGAAEEPTAARSDKSGTSTPLPVEPVKTRRRSTIPIVTAVEIAPPVYTAITSAPLTSTVSIPVVTSPLPTAPGAARVYTSAMHTVPLTGPLPTFDQPPPPPSKPVSSPTPPHPLFPPMNFVFTKDWSCASQTGSVRQPSSECLAAAGEYKADAKIHEKRVREMELHEPKSTDGIQMQLHELLLSQETLKDELRNVREQIANNYSYLEKFRSDLQPKVHEAVAPSTNQEHFPVRQSQTADAQSQDVGAFDGHFEDTVGVGDSASRDGGASEIRHKKSGSRAHGKQEVSPNLGYDRNNDLFTTLSSHFHHHVGQVHKSIPDKAKFCCWT